MASTKRTGDSSETDSVQHNSVEHNKAVIAELAATISEIEAGSRSSRSIGDASHRSADANTLSSRPADIPSSDELESVEISPAHRDARKYLTRVVAQRPITVNEATKKLQARDLDQTVITETIAWACTAKLLDDRTYAQLWIEDRGRKRGYGPARLARELRRRGISEDDIELAMTNLDDVDHRAKAYELAVKRYATMSGRVEPPRATARLVGYLQRRGYQQGLSLSVAREVTAQDR